MKHKEINKILRPGLTLVILAISLALVFSLLILPQVKAAEAVTTISKTGKSTALNSTVNTQPGDTIDWVVDYSNDGVGDPVTGFNITDIIPAGQTYVPNSLKSPLVLNKLYSSNGGASYTSTEPANTNSLRVSGDISSPATGDYDNLLKPASAITTSTTSGDGYQPNVIDGKLYSVYHHTRTIERAADSNINCYNLVTGVQCPGYPQDFNSVAGSSNVSADINTPENNRTIVYGKKIYYNASRVNDYGIGCWDTVSNTNCGYWILDTGSLQVVSATTTNPMHGDLIQVGDNLYTAAANGKITCFNLVSSAPCSGQPYTVSTTATGYPASSTGGNGTVNSLEYIGGKIFIKYVVDGMPGVWETMRYSCFDPVTNLRCSDAGWATDKNNGSIYYNTAGIIPVSNASGVGIGFCNLAFNRYDVAPANCFNLNGTTMTPPAGLFTNPGIIALGGASNTKETTWVGTKVYISVMAYEAVGGGAYCYDYAITAPCTGFGTNGFKQWTTINGGQTSDYAYRYANGCMYGLGHGGIFWSFDPADGSYPCLKSKLTMDLSPKTFYCDGLTHATQYDKIKSLSVLPGGVTFRVTVYQNDGLTPVSGFNNVLLPVSGVLDISTIPTTGVTDKITVVIDATGNFANNVPFQVLYTSTDKPQICYKTVVDSNFTGSKVTNTATSNKAASATAELDILPSTITGKVYLDINNSGTQDGAEPNGSIPAGTTVVLTQTVGGSNTYTVTLNPDGTYSQAVLPGTYTATVTAPVGYTVTGGSNPTTGVVAVAGQTIAAGNDGLTKLVKVTGLAFKDLNGDNIRSANEELAPGLDVSIISSTGQVINTVKTNNLGAFEFETVPGSYTIRYGTLTNFNIFGAESISILVDGNVSEVRVADKPLVQKPSNTSTSNSLSRTGGYYGNTAILSIVFILISLLSLLLKKKIVSKV